MIKIRTTTDAMRGWDFKRLKVEPGLVLEYFEKHIKL